MTVLYSGGEAGAVGIADEYDPIAATGAPGTFVAPTSFIMAESQGLDDQPNQISRKVYAGPGRDSDVGHRTGKSVVGGPIGLALYPHNGLMMLYKTLGKKVSISALSADTTTGITTTGNTVAVALSSGGAYNANDIVFLGTSGTSTYEPLPVLSYNSGTKTLTLPLPKNTHASVGTAVHRLAHDQGQPITVSDAVGDVLGTMSILKWVGSKYATAFPGLYGESWKLTANASKMDVAVSTVSMAESVPADGVGSHPAATAFTEGTDWGELAFEFSPDSFLVFPSDPTDSGTATLQLVPDITEYSIEIKNNFKAENTANRSTAMRQFPKDREVNLTFAMLNPASYPVNWTKFVKGQLNIPFFAFMALNIGTPAVPVWVAMSFYCPNVRVLTAKTVDGLTDTIGETMTAVALSISNQPKMTVSVYAP
jgi:hypothetical protein